MTKDTGKQWHEQKKAFRPTAGLSSYEKRAEKRKEQDAMKAKEKEMKEEKEATRKVRLLHNYSTCDMSTEWCG